VGNGLNDLKKLMPNIDEILSKQTDGSKIGKDVLDIPSSSSSTEPSQTNHQTIPRLKHLSIKEWNAIIERVFLVQMPQTFFLFWDLCKEIFPLNPQSKLYVFD